ncbi:MAG TPA: hypothetical protein VIY86_09015, partial [Pirellulaceae bacterium]
MRFIDGWKGGGAAKFAKGALFASRPLRAARVVAMLLALALNPAGSALLFSQSPAELAERADRVTRQLGDHTYHLRYQQNAGDVLRYRVDHQVTVKTTIDGSTQNSQSRSRSVKCWRVTTANPQSIQLVHEIESVDMWS